MSGRSGANKTDRFGRFAVRLVAGSSLLLPASPSLAHPAEQAFVLILPTDIYIAAGIAAILATLLLLTLPPVTAWLPRWSSAWALRAHVAHFVTATSLISLALLAALVTIGVTGSRDPLTNPLPLFIWTVWWLIIVILHAVFGFFWRWVNPWTGLSRLALRGARPILRLPDSLGQLPAIAGFLLFAIFLLADPAPTDPARLAYVAGAYWLITFAGMALFGPGPWLSRCEFISVLLRNYSMLSPLAYSRSATMIGAPGWQILRFKAITYTGSVFVIIMLGTGSFEGLNETFWWLALIGINPLEFPGRSAIIRQSVAGLLSANLLLIVLFGLVVWLGLAVVGERGRYREAFCRQAWTLLPIALGYHIAHYLTALIVNVQYAFAAASDPFATGADWLGIQPFYVTTGFFNTRDSVEVIWLTQASAVVIGHISAILLSHAVAAGMFQNHRKAVFSQIPISVFMVAYTMFGLWLLASPRGGA